MRSLSKFFSRKDRGSSHVNKNDARATGKKRAPASAGKAALMRASDASESSTSEPSAIKGPVYVPRAPARLKEKNPGSKLKAASPGKNKPALKTELFPSRMGYFDHDATVFIDPPSRNKTSSSSSSSTEPLPSRMGYFDHDATVFIDPPSQKKTPSSTSTKPLPSRMGHFDPDATTFLN